MSTTSTVTSDQLRRAGRESSADKHPGTIRAYYPFWDTQDPKQGWVTVVDLPDHASLYAALEKAHQSTQRWLDNPRVRTANVGKLVAPCS